MNAPLYTIDILRLASALPAPAALDRIDGTGVERSPTCGSTVTTRVQLDDARWIEQVSQDVQACAFGQAAAAIVARHATGRTGDEVETALEQLSAWLSGQRDVPPDWPGFETLASARSRASRHPAILLPLRALRAAIESAR
ncbi:iron-sulfur cluster assembly scaffold protein [Sphingomonas sabuli]|uniref:Iron-sulfur cluster assembly scaffold protein n=1 Tax=Sphingomonas sabuli TaxID=2764186 RepID=A0A7G9L224_9SPHN|nr:iron-sulfur cluster assembly scaffold protein [Sphingomonas sabuli]QNM82673.1 iron-sulfur cluster assembly scaffold protein [Sphingomonas sabuli]